MATPRSGRERLGLIEPPDAWSAEQQTNVNGHQVSSALEGVACVRVRSASSTLVFAHTVNASFAHTARA